MVKSKKPKKQVNLKPEFAVDRNASKHNKQKKKNAPDRPQPEWMFPPDEENPVLNPKAKSEEKQLKDKQEHDHAIKFLEYKSVTTPMKAPPPALLLTLVGAFLSSYGFNSTSRIYSTELASRKKLDEWKVLMDEKLPKGYPDLVKLFKEGHRTYEEKMNMNDTSSSDSQDDDERKAYKNSKKNSKAKVEGTSSSGSTDDSSDDSDSDAAMEDAPSVSKSNKATMKAPAKRSSSFLSASTSSDSDADDEKEFAGAPIPTSKASATPTVNGMVNKLKRKAGPTVGEPPTREQPRGGRITAESADSSSETSSSESESEKEVAKLADPTSAPLPASESDSSSSSSESDSEADFSTPANTTIITTTPTTSSKPRNGSSSSETLKASSDQKVSTADTSLSSSSDSDSSDADVDMIEPKVTTITTQTTATKRKRSTSPTTPPSKKTQKKTNTPFERVPKDTPIDERFSNKYKSYDYADRAHQDLIVTKGKGFTKEKNKKKKGSYRGGAIDTGGGKGIKFED